jgi:hypothetical protein
MLLNFVLNLIQYWFSISQNKDQTLKQVQGDMFGGVIDKNVRRKFSDLNM